jgi:hypothetical protein
MMLANFLEELPCEVISLVLENLRPTDWQRALLTSKQWHELGRRVFISHLMTKMLSTSWSTCTNWTRMGGEEMDDLTTSTTSMLCSSLAVRSVIHLLVTTFQFKKFPKAADENVLQIVGSSINPNYTSETVIEGMTECSQALRYALLISRHL